MLSKAIKCTTLKMWVIISVANFLMVGCLGVLMRYKFLYTLPWINQKFLLHAHSHFAFTGWVTTALMVFFFAALHGYKAKDIFPKQEQLLLFSNLLISYLMLFSFAVSGYSVASIIFSFLAVVTSYIFVIYGWRLLSKHKVSKGAEVLFRSALAFNLISSLGTFGLIFLKATHSSDLFSQTAAINFYLHFQYNGWFLFGCMGLFIHIVQQHRRNDLLNSSWFKGYAISVFPTYFLSIFWLKDVGGFVLLAIFLALVFQLIFWVRLILSLFNSRAYLKNENGALLKHWKIVLICIGFALVLKLLLQMVSLMPGVSEIVYGFRPVVIAYLHLVLLVIVSMFLLIYGLSQLEVSGNPAVKF